MSTPLLVRSLDSLLPRSAREFGGKAVGLAALVQGGFPVPAAHVVSSRAALETFERVLPSHLQPAQLLSARPVDEQALAQAQKRVLAATLDAELQQALSKAFAALRASDADEVAVRSSSTAEDQDAVSAAGLHHSVLDVRDEAQLFDAVRHCWASVFHPRVASYLQALGAERVGAMGLVIQAMVPADSAGVLMTVNPLSGDPAQMLISASYGLGTAVTDGSVTPDSYCVDKVSGWISDRVLGDKARRLVLGPEGGLRSESVPTELARKEALDEYALGRLIEVGRRIEQYFGDARDVEFAFVDDELFILQARPLGLGFGATNAARPSRRPTAHARDGRSIVWSNVNVGEALPGVATPLTWSVLSDFSELGFRQAFAALGCKVPREARLVGSFRGRIYLNLSELVEIGSQVPGVRPTSVLPLGGGAEVERLELALPRRGSAGYLLRLPAIAARFASSNLGLASRLQAFETRFGEERARIEALDLRILPAAALDQTLSDVRRLLDEAGAILLTNYGGLLAALLPLRAALRLLSGARADGELQTLLSAIEEVEAALPGRELLSVAEAFARDVAARELLLGSEAGALSGRQALTAIEGLGACAARDAFATFLSRHGHRGVREAELSEPRWREDPGLLIDALRLHVKHAGSEPARRLEQRLLELRKGADQALSSYPAPLRPALSTLLSLVRRSLRTRERLRSHVVRILGFFRIIALDVSRRLRVREPEVGPDAAFFLNLPELHGVLRSERTAVLSRVALRRRQYERERSLPDPPDTFVGYPPPLSSEPLDHADETLRGHAAGPGAVEAKARVLRSVGELAKLEPGEVLVVPSADVGWAPLFVLAGALVTERGGPLSHACVVAREYGLPAVVNVSGATRRIESGDRLRVDGDSGVVQVLSRG